jgi:NAD(P)-dependent dehydrogenase (short-subunit alcohol dehydrogenase family)
MGRLDGKVAIVSGAARGIGAAVAQRLRVEGATVIAGDVIDPCMDTSGLIWWGWDVTDADAWQSVVQHAETAYGHLDILINNAGISEYEPIHKVTVESWKRIVAVNQTGVWLGMRAAVSSMLRSGGGAIVNVSSILGAAAIPGEHVYHATKGAVLSMTRNAAVTYAADRIRVNAVLPGWIRTPMTEGQDPELNAAFVASTPMLRGAEPDELAAAVAFLVSEDASYVTGVELAVDGGYLAQSAPLSGAPKRIEAAAL